MSKRSAGRFRRHRPSRRLGFYEPEPLGDSIWLWLEDFALAFGVIGLGVGLVFLGIVFKIVLM